METMINELSELSETLETPEQEAKRSLEQDKGASEHSLMTWVMQMFPETKHDSTGADRMYMIYELCLRRPGERLADYAKALEHITGKPEGGNRRAMQRMFPQDARPWVIDETSLHRVGRGDQAEVRPHVCIKCGFARAHDEKQIEDVFGWRIVDGRRLKQSYCRWCRGAKGGKTRPIVLGELNCVTQRRALAKGLVLEDPDERVKNNFFGTRGY